MKTAVMRANERQRHALQHDRNGHDRVPAQESV